MTRSLSGVQSTSIGAPAPGAEPAPRGTSRVRIPRRAAVLDAVTRLTLRAIPRLPDRLKRQLLGRRSITIDGNTLDTTLQLMLSAQRAAGIGGLVGDDDPVAARTLLRTLAAMMHTDIHAQVHDVSIPGPAGAIPARHYRPTGTEAPLLVFYHGGGFAIGDLDTHDALCRLICRDGRVHVLSVDYRLAPEHKAPAAVDDAYAAYRWALDHAGELGADPSRVAVGGDSAGGNLAALVSLLARDGGVQSPALQLLLYPVTDMHAETRSRTLFAEGFFLTKRDIDWFTDHYLGGSDVDAADPRVSPLLADDLSGLPPAMVLTAGFDPLRDEGKQYAEAMRAAGVTVDLREMGSLVHGFASFFALGGRSTTATTEMISALRAHLSHG
jgi:acetyl esterase